MGDGEGSEVWGLEFGAYLLNVQQQSKHLHDR